MVYCLQVSAAQKGPPQKGGPLLALSLVELRGVEPLTRRYQLRVLPLHYNPRVRAKRTHAIQEALLL